MLKTDQMKRTMGTMRRRLGPLGLSLVAAALTATAFAGVSVAQDDSENGNGDSAQKRNGDVLRAPGPGGPPMFSHRLSEEDRQALEEFRQCMEDNGAPAPPGPGSFNPEDGPPAPPSEEDRAAIDKALETCESKLPEGVHGFGPGGPGCGPPPGIAPNQGDSGDQQSAPQGSSSRSAS